MEPSLISLLPPVIVLLVGYFTKKVQHSLLLGVFVASIIVTGSPLQGLYLTGYKLFQNLEALKLYEKGISGAWNILICIFLFYLGIFITLLHHSGAAKAYEVGIKKRLKNKRQAQSASLILSICLFIDDYFSSLTVGSVMKPITDSFKIPRAKLAYLVDSMAAPLAIICPISSWVAATVGFLRDGGVRSEASAQTLIQGSPYLAYLNIIPYIFYSFIVIVGCWAMVLAQFSFGKMALHEKLAFESGNLHGGKTPPLQRLEQNEQTGNGSLSDFFFLIFALICFIVLGLAHSGSWVWLGGDNSFADAIRSSSAAHGLFIGGTCIVLLQVSWLGFRGLLNLSQLPRLAWEGVLLMLPSVIVLMLAWTLGDLLSNDLKTGEFLAKNLVSTVNLAWLPFLLFSGSMITSVCIGSSWGTAAIMFPIAIQMYLNLYGYQGVVQLEEVGTLFPLLGAVLSGCVAGDHISPISDTTIMSATSTGMNHIDHVETQIGYAIPMIGVCAVTYVILGHTMHNQSSMSLYACQGFYALSCILVLWGLNRRYGQA